jgi:hypothetical protein
MIVLNLFTKFSVHHMVDPTLHAILTGAHKRAADLYPVHGSDDPSSRPGRAEQTIAFTLAGQGTAQSQNSIGIIASESVPQGVFAQSSNAFAKNTLPAFRFDPVQGRKLTSGSQKYGIKDLFSGMLWIPAAFRQSLHSCREIKHLIEVALELVSTQD